MATINKQDASTILAQKAILFKDSTFLDLFSGYALKAFGVFLAFLFIIGIVAVGIYLEWVWFIVGATFISLSAGMAAASLKDFRNKIKIVQTNKGLLPAKVHNHFIRFFARKR